MRIEQEFEVKRPVERVWEFFQDVPTVAQCLPGAELTEDLGEGRYAGKLSAKLGPMTATFEGEATVVADHESRSGAIKGKGVDRRGGSRGQVEVDYRLERAHHATKVSLEADVTLSGAAAQFGRTGLIKEMSIRLISDFVECLEAKLGAESEEEAATITAPDVKGFSLLVSSLWSRLVVWVKRLLGRG